MSIEAVGAIDADLARVAAAEGRLAAAHAEDVPVGGSDPSKVEHGHAAVASAEAALAQAEAAVSADRAAPETADQAASLHLDPGAADAHSDSTPLVSTHLLDTVA